jgi:hypothetical protein
MLSKFVDAFFGCWHSHYSFPITVRPGLRRGASSVTGTYVVCLDCGKEQPYDWKQMKVISSVEQYRRNEVRALATKEAA